jgi:hypothetical protein
LRLCFCVESGCFYATQSFTQSPFGAFGPSARRFGDGNRPSW